ncbi:hypothetical protein ACQKIY_25610 [Bacillus mycoides]|uniref:hypothetical protein n=1 Tax=Bacillus mycoides TaxID=1405 RepID=UPI003CFC5BDA
MIKIGKFVCGIDTCISKNGTFLARKTYWGRVSRSGSSTLMLSEEKQWVKVSDSKMTTGNQPIINFVLIDVFFPNNKTELNELIQG